MVKPLFNLHMVKLTMIMISLIDTPLKNDLMDNILINDQYVHVSSLVRRLAMKCYADYVGCNEP